MRGSLSRGVRPNPFVTLRREMMVFGLETRVEEAPCEEERALSDGLVCP
jgi:hypothetical protein